MFGSKLKCKRAYLGNIVIPTNKHCIHSKKERMQMVMGMDVKIKEVSLFMGKVVVGLFCRKVVRPGILKTWLERNWDSSLGYVPMFHALV